MANRFPLIVNSGSNAIQELAAGDNLDLTSSGISNVGDISSVGVVTATTVNATTAVQLNGTSLPSIDDVTALSIALG
jgi:hypothetical protein